MQTFALLKSNLLLKGIKQSFVLCFLCEGYHFCGWVENPAASAKVLKLPRATCYAMLWYLPMPSSRITGTCRQTSMQHKWRGLSATVSNLTSVNFMRAILWGHISPTITQEEVWNIPRNISLRLQMLRLLFVMFPINFTGTHFVPVSHMQLPFSC